MTDKTKDAMSEEFVTRVVENMNLLTDDERLQVMGHFCKGCGCIEKDSKGNTIHNCYCMNDE